MKQRLNKIIAISGICSRRKADELIASGKVKINGITVTALGTQADLSEDAIMVNNRPLKKEENVYILFHKPKGCITTTKDMFAEKTIFDILPKFPVRVFPVGRLDKNTEGLLILTNDGDMTQKLLHPKHEIKRVYEVCVKGTLTQAMVERIEKGGLKIEDYRTSACNIKILSRTTLKTQLTLSLHEGKKREIRKIFDTVGHPVINLKRIQFGNIRLGNLAKGKWKYITKESSRAKF
ncbi:MAG: rRNA pseudouridine synthase [Candidatus Omnitrophica bacterium]|nr:rRNA pseudouridine synthase [Candidatus Omnitrophota bacterium]